MTDLEAHRLILAAGSRWGYQAAVLIAAVLGAALARRDSRDWSMSSGRRYQLLGLAALGSLVGCAIPAFFAGGTIGVTTTSFMLAPKTILGGLLGGFFLVAAYKRLVGDTVDTSDAFARGAIMMMLIGRLGCVSQHCCYGAVSTSSWGVDLGDGAPRVPVQYVEAIGLLLLALVGQWLHRGDRLRGRRLFALFTAYGLMRFGLEVLRAPVADSLWGVGFYQWVALLLAGVGIYQLRKRSRSLST